MKNEIDEKNFQIFLREKNKYRLSEIEKLAAIK